MRACVVGASVWLLGCGVACAAQPSENPPTVVVSANQGQPAYLATYRGPAGIPVPVGACAALVDGHLWVLPCTDPRVAAYRHTMAVDAARATRQSHQAEAVAVLVVGAVSGAVTEWLHRRRAARAGEV